MSQSSCPWPPARLQARGRKVKLGLPNLIHAGVSIAKTLEQCAVFINVVFLFYLSRIAQWNRPRLQAEESLRPGRPSGKFVRRDFFHSLGIVLLFLSANLAIAYAPEPTGKRRDVIRTAL